MVSNLGLWGQLRFLGDRIESLVMTGQSSSALASAHLALNLLQYSPESAFPAGQISELRHHISREETCLGALRQLVSLTKGESPALPALWRLGSHEEPTELRKLIWIWRQSLGAQLFRLLRYQHTRYSPTGQAGNFLFRLSFDPRSGLVQGVVLPHFFPPQPVSLVSQKEAHAFFSYSRDARRFYLWGNQPQSITVAGTQREIVGLRNVPQHESGVNGTVAKVIESVDGSAPEFPRFQLRRMLTEEGIIYELDPSLARSNQKYARRTLSDPGEFSMMMTIQWDWRMMQALRSEDQSLLEGLMPRPDIFLSVADNGAFVGVVYHLPEKQSPRGTVYEIGTPELGRQAFLQYEIYRNEAVTDQAVRVPIGVRWIEKPNRHQKRAVQQWIASAEFGAIRSGWTMIRRA